jgi:heptosyltransferase-2
MAKKKDDAAEKIMVLALGGIGNLVLLIPALKALRRHFPRGHIALLTGEPGVENVMPSAELWDEVILWDRRHFSGWRCGLSIIRDVRQRSFHVSISSSGTHAGKGAFLTWLMGIPRRLGEDGHCWGPGYTDPVPFDASENELESNLRLLGPLGIHEKAAFPLLEISAPEEKEALDFLAREGLSSSAPLVGIHAGSGPRFRALKRWPSASFVELAGQLRARFGAQIVLTGGEQEQDLARGIARSLSFPVINAAGRLNLRQSAALIRQCRLFISNDSGIAHVAAALGGHVIVIFGPTNIQRIAPQGPGVVILQDPGRDIRDVAVEDVMSAAQKVLQA